MSRTLRPWHARLISFLMYVLRHCLILHIGMTIDMSGAVLLLPTVLVAIPDDALDLVDTFSSDVFWLAWSYLSSMYGGMRAVPYRLRQVRVRVGWMILLRRPLHSNCVV